MATLVFTAIGTALGGPVGGAIGSLLGQSIDQQWLGSSRKGPRLGDLGVQTSSYGTHIPRVYGTMRVAGSVIWSTDLREGTTQVGAKGQPDTTVYSYSVSFAVALSSRPLGRIKRIWADGKLLRGESGDFKVDTKFRFYPGSEDQAIDPLIGSVEGITATPAYRGLAIAVFEDLQLAEYGNRIPFLTFETEAEAAPVSIAAVLNDASGGVIAGAASGAVLGYAAHGPSMSAAVEPLVDRFGVELFDDGAHLRSAGSGTTLTIAADELGAASEERGARRVERTQAPARTLPAAMTLTYYDPERDFQTGQMRASIGDGRGSVQASELPAVLAADAAKSLVEGELARRWAERDQLTLRLMPKAMTIAPGARIRFDGQTWTVHRMLIERMVTVVELRPQWRAPANLAADAGRASSAADLAAGEVSLALFELPYDEADPQGGAALYLAAASDVSGWRPVAVEAEVAGTTTSLRSAPRQSVLGSAVLVLAPGSAELIDMLNAVEVELVDPDQWLESCDDAALAAGANLAVIGGELIQFGSAVPNGPRRFVLSRLVRGRRGSEWAIDQHAAGESFALLLPGTLQPIRLSPGMRGAAVAVRTARAGAGGAPLDERVVASEALRPPSPVRLTASADGAGGMSIRWVRRSRAGWGWVDEVDAPLGETREAYAVTVQGSGGRLETETQASALLLGPDDLATLGQGGAVVTVQQIGDFAASRPATLNINL